MEYFYTRHYEDVFPPTTLEQAARVQECSGGTEDSDLVPAQRFILGIAWALGGSAAIYGAVILWASVL